MPTVISHPQQIGLFSPSQLEQGMRVGPGSRVRARSLRPDPEKAKLGKEFFDKAKKFLEEGHYATSRGLTWKPITQDGFEEDIRLGTVKVDQSVVPPKVLISKNSRAALDRQWYGAVVEMISDGQVIANLRLNPRDDQAVAMLQIADGEQLKFLPGHTSFEGEYQLALRPVN